MISNKGIWLLSLVLFTSCSTASNLVKLEEKHQKSIGSERGKAFEMKAVGAFWGNAAFMQECVPADAVSLAPIVIYFEVVPDGSLGELVVSPEDDVARCISDAVSKRRFPAPPHEWWGKIELSFTG